MLRPVINIGNHKKNDSILQQHPTPLPSPSRANWGRVFFVLDMKLIIPNLKKTKTPAIAGVFVF